MIRAHLLLVSLMLGVSALGCDGGGKSTVTPSTVPPDIRVGSELIIGMNNTPYQDPALWKQIVVKEISGHWIKVEFVPRVNAGEVNSTVTGWVNFNAVNWYTITN